MNDSIQEWFAALASALTMALLLALVKVLFL